MPCLVERNRVVQEKKREIAFLAGFFNEKFANRLAMVGMACGRAASTIRLKFRLKFCFLTITQMFLNGIDW